MNYKMKNNIKFIIKFSFFSLFLIPTHLVKAWPNKATVFTEDCLNQGAIGVCYDKNTRDYYYTDYGIRTIAGNCSETRPAIMEGDLTKRRAIQMHNTVCVSR